VTVRGAQGHVFVCLCAKSSVDFVPCPSPSFSPSLNLCAQPRGNGRRANKQPSVDKPGAQRAVSKLQLLREVIRKNQRVFGVKRKKLLMRHAVLAWRPRDRDARSVERGLGLCAGPPAAWLRIRTVPPLVHENANVKAKLKLYTKENENENENPSGVASQVEFVFTSCLLASTRSAG